MSWVLTKGKHGMKISLLGEKEEAGDGEEKGEAGREGVDLGPPEASGSHHMVRALPFKRALLKALQASVGLFGVWLGFSLVCFNFHL